MKKTMLLLLGLFLTIIIQAQTATAPSSGDGSSSNPYEIATLNNLYWLSVSDTAWDKHYIQTDDIDASATSSWNVGDHDEDGGTTPEVPMGFSPIGSNVENFTGSYNGKGHIISNLFINRPTAQRAGFFGTSSANIDSLGIVDLDYNFRTGGGLVGNNSDTINNCYTTGNIVGGTAYMNITGGLVGEGSGLINNSYSSCNVTAAQYYSSGLLGYNSGTVHNSYCTGSINNSYGLVGTYNTHAITAVENCFWDTIACGTSISTGGTGKNTTDMKDIATFTDVSTEGLDVAWDFVGTINDDTGEDDIWAIGPNGYPALSWQDSLVSIVTTDSISNITVSNIDINANMVFLGSSNPTAHGFCWNTTGTPTTSDNTDDKGTTSSTGIFTSTLSSINDGQTYYIRAFATNEFGTYYGNEMEFSSDNPIVLTDSISNITDNSAIGYANITALGSSSITNHGFCWNLTGNPTVDDSTSDEGATSSTGPFTSNLSDLISGSKYYAKSYVINTDGDVIYGDEICFTIIVEPTGSGTEGDPYQIATLGNLRWLSESDTAWNRYYIQTANIDASTTSTWNIGNHDNDGGTPNEPMGFSPIGNSTTYFTGSYDGQEYIIDSLYINRPTITFAGLFGKISTATISNTNLTNADIIGYTNVGALVGNSENSVINHCYSSGIIQGAYSGGLIGSAHTSSVIQNCYSNANVSSSAATVGGFIANANSTSINYCYSTGTVSGTNSLGGFCGDVNSSTIENSFWNTETSGMTTSAAGTGITTSQMQDINTFLNTSTSGLDNAWDFVGNLYEDAETEDIWVLNNNYFPVFTWQDSLISMVQTNSLTDKTATSVTANGNLIFLGSSNPTSYGFCWNTSGDPTISDNMDDKGSASSTGEYSSSITGLTSGQSYYVKAFAINEFGTFYGNELEFNSASASITTDSITNITDTSAVAYGNILDIGSSDVIAHGFCWNTTGNPTIANNKTDEGSGSIGTFSTDLTNLVSGSTYYAKAYATNDGGTFYGDEISFTIIIEPTGSGTEADPYQIATLGNLRWLSENSDHWDKHYIQTEDIDASTTSEWNIGNHDNDAGTAEEAMGFSPIGNLTTAFDGTYKGQGHIINGLFINRPIVDYIGLFGYVNTSEIDSIGVINVDITGHSYVGGLIGYLINTHLNECYTSGNIEGYSTIGGLLGRTNNYSINNCYSTGNVIADNYYAGGLIGFSNSTVNNCYSTGSASGSDYVGGLIGSNGSTVNKSYWDIETSGITIDNSAGTGQSTAEMKEICNYLSSEWSFGDIWLMNNAENNGYPVLAWQGIENTETCPVYLSGSFIANDKTYDGTTTASINENLLELSSDEPINDFTITDIVVEFEDANVGTGKTVNISSANLEGTNADFSNFDLAGAPSTTADIEKATITATARDTSRVVGEANPAFKIDYTGFQNGEDESEFSTTPTASTTADESSLAGTYEITVSGGEADNYTFTYVSGILTINAQTAIEGISNNKILIYPNPVSDYLHIENISKNNKEIYLYDIVGNLMETFSTSDSDIINLSSYKSGVYFIKIENYTVKIIKK